jgi:DHA2 family multidrug resistance protein
MAIEQHVNPLLAEPRTDFTTRVLASMGLMAAMLLTVLDSTIANVALPHMQGSLSASQDQMAWVLTSYIVGTAIMTPLSGWISFKTGRKPLYLFSIASFVGISMFCGVATSLPEMVVLRLLQGAAGASVMPLTQATLIDLWPASVRQTVMAIWSTVVMVGPIAGPLIGGYLTETYSWRYVFYINLPLGALAFFLCATALERDPGGRQRPFDVIGYFALVLFSGSAQLMVDRGPTQDWFASPEILIEAILAICGLYMFVLQMLTAKHPFFHTDLFRDRNFFTAITFQVSLQAVTMSTMALLPTMVQRLLGYSALQSGDTTLWRGVGAMIGFGVAPWLASRVNPRVMIIPGIFVMSASLYAMGKFDLSMTATSVEATGFFLGLGQSVMFNPVSVLAFATLDQRHRTEAAVFSNMLRTSAGSLSIGLSQAYLSREMAVAHEALTSHISTADPMLRWSLPGFFNGGHASLEALNAEITRQASMMAYDAVFAWMSLGALCLLPLVFILKPARPGVVAGM